MPFHAENVVVAVAIGAALLASAAQAQSTAGTDATAQAIAPIRSCDIATMQAAPLVSDYPTASSTNPPNDTSVTVVSVSTTTNGGIPVCIVNLLVKPAINIRVGLPMGANWNGKLQSEGGGGYAGSVGNPASTAQGYVGVQTDTGHTGGSGTFGCINDCAGATQAAPGSADKQRQLDFIVRSEHLMAVLGKQLANYFYGTPVTLSYWNGCSTGGRQGLKIAQTFPNDYNGLLVGAPAIHWDRFQAYQIWPQVTRNIETNGTVYTSANLTAKQNLATNAAVASCQSSPAGIGDGYITDARKCTYDPRNDATITKASCTATDPTCLSPAEATFIFKTWDGARSASGKLLWPGNERGAALNGLGGTAPFNIATAQPQYWVYFYPQWDWHTLNYDNYEAFFNLTQIRVGPISGSDNPNLSAFKATGGKTLMWHGGADQLIMTRGTNMYYDAVANMMAGGDYSQLMPWFRYFIAPGVGHCSGGAGPQPQNLFGVLTNWVENGQAPDRITSQRTVNGQTQTRPLCPYPSFAQYTGSGSINDQNNFACVVQP